MEVVCPVSEDTKANSVEHIKKASDWRRDNSKAAALIAITMSPFVANLVMHILMQRTYVRN